MDGQGARRWRICAAGLYSNAFEAAGALYREVCALSARPSGADWRLRHSFLSRMEGSAASVRAEGRAGVGAPRSPGFLLRRPVLHFARFAWKGGWTAALLAVIVAEIILTLWDFVVEITVRKDLGDVYAGERVTHAIMGITYGAMLAALAPTLYSWWTSPTSLAMEPAMISEWLRGVVGVMGVGVLLSGLRDLYAAAGLPGGDWPWSRPDLKLR